MVRSAWSLQVCLSMKISYSNYIKACLYYSILCLFLHGTTLHLMNLNQKRIIMDLPIKSYFCILSAYKNKSKTQIQYLCIPLSVGTATLFRHCSLRGPLMSTPLPFEWLMNEGTIDLLVAPTFHGLPRVWFDLASLRHQFWELKWFKKGG